MGVYTGWIFLLKLVQDFYRAGTGSKVRFGTRRAKGRGRLSNILRIIYITSLSPRRSRVYPPYGAARVCTGADFSQI